MADSEITLAPHLKPILTREEAALYAGGISVVTLDRWRKFGADGRPPLPCLALGKVVLIDREALHSWLTSVQTVSSRGRGRPSKHPLRR